MSCCIHNLFKAKENKHIFAFKKQADRHFLYYWSVIKIIIGFQLIIVCHVEYSQDIVF